MRWALSEANAVPAPCTCSLVTWSSFLAAPNLPPLPHNPGPVAANSWDQPWPTLSSLPLGLPHQKLPTVRSFLPQNRNLLWFSSSIFQPPGKSCPSPLAPSSRPPLPHVPSQAESISPTPGRPSVPLSGCTLEPIGLIISSVSRGCQVWTSWGPWQHEGQEGLYVSLK